MRVVDCTNDTTSRQSVHSSPLRYGRHCKRNAGFAQNDIFVKWFFVRLLISKIQLFTYNIFHENRLQTDVQLQLRHCNRVSFDTVCAWNPKKITSTYLTRKSSNVDVTKTYPPTVVCFRYSINQVTSKAMFLMSLR